MIDVHDTTAEDVARRLAEHGVLVSVWSSQRVRVVTHLDVASEDIDAAAGIVRTVLERA